MKKVFGLMMLLIVCVGLVAVTEAKQTTMTLYGGKSNSLIKEGTVNPCHTAVKLKEMEKVNQTTIYTEVQKKVAGIWVTQDYSSMVFYKSSDLNVGRETNFYKINGTFDTKAVWTNKSTNADSYVYGTFYLNSYTV